MNGPIQNEILDEIGKLSAEEQRQVLRFVLSLTARKSGRVSEEDLRKLQGDFDPEDLKEMARLIEEECERIDPNEW